MTKIVLTFGLISGAVITVLMWMMLWAMKAGVANQDHGYFWGYATMIVALSLVFFGIKSYRDNNGGKISFLKGLQVGILISLISAICYGASWEVYYRSSGSDFMQQYSQKYIEKMKNNGASDAEIAKAQTEMAQMIDMYQNFFIRFAMTLMEIVPVGVIVTLVSAALLRKREMLPAEPA